MKVLELLVLVEILQGTVASISLKTKRLISYKITFEKKIHQKPWQIGNIFSHLHSHMSLLCIIRLAFQCEIVFSCK